MQERIAGFLVAGDDARSRAGRGECREHGECHQGRQDRQRTDHPAGVQPHRPAQPQMPQQPVPPVPAVVDPARQARL